MTDDGAKTSCDQLNEHTLQVGSHKICKQSDKKYFVSCVLLSFKPSLGVGSILATGHPSCLKGGRSGKGGGKKMYHL